LFFSGARSLTRKNLRTWDWVSLNSDEEREDVRRRVRRPPTRKRPLPPQGGAAQRAIHHRRPLRLLQVPTRRRTGTAPRATHDRFIHYRGGPMPESIYWRLGMKRSLRREIILCLEFIGTARENGRCGAVIDVL
jgi:hypothetical protein